MLNPKPSNWLLAVPTMSAIVLVSALCYTDCSASNPQLAINDPTTLCANALVTSQEFGAQATKLGLEPAALAKQVCTTAILGVQLIEANLRKASGSAGAPNAPDWLPMGIAGTAGTGG